MRRFIFDVDGTLTPSRCPIEPDFKKFFAAFCANHSVFLVTGSDREKTLEQIGPVIYTLVDRVYQCSGNDIWEGDKNISTRTIEVPERLQDAFDHWLETSPFPERTGRHVEVRPGLINFSILGRNADAHQRIKYYSWDKFTSEREMIAEDLNNQFPEYMFQVAGETGIDVIPQGKDKSQIIHDFSPHDELHFFGDKMYPGGNDYYLALEVAQMGGSVYNVKSPLETKQILEAVA